MPRTCKYCGKELTHEDKRRKYCDRACYKADKKSDRYKPCEICGSMFYLHYFDQRFCSKKCRLKAGWMNTDPTKKTTTICEICGKSFSGWVYRKRRFCSRLCANKNAARQPKPSARRPEKFITRPCARCGKLFTDHVIQFETRNRKHCSLECAHDALSENRRGKNNPNWTGGTAEPDAYGPNWERQKRKAKRRDSHTCQICGYKSGGMRYLDVHHIIPVKEFNGNWRKANALSNLVSLCRKCHILVEKKKIPCPVPREG